MKTTAVKGKVNGQNVTTSTVRPRRRQKIPLWDATSSPEFKETKKEVIRILGINEKQYSEFVFEAGIRWLEKVPSRINAQNNIYAQTYWDFYREQYHFRDKQFVKECIEGQLYQRPRKELNSLYKQIHSDLGVIHMTDHLTELFKSIRNIL